MNQANSTSLKQQIAHSEQSRPPTEQVSAYNEFGESLSLSIPGEHPLTIVLEGHELVTLMTIGTRPEELALGYVRNQRLIDDINRIKSVKVDWENEQVLIDTHYSDSLRDWREKLFKRIITSGCGQGTIFASTLEELDTLQLPQPSLKQSTLYALIEQVRDYNPVYRQAGAVHSCALCQGATVLTHVEDVGRHNAADAISGYLWVNGIQGEDKIFYTTGRLTSEMVMKAAFMGIPIVVSRSGTTQMGFDMAKRLGMMIISRAKGRHFVVYQGGERIEFDQTPPRRSKPAPTKGQRDL